jgi:UDP-perosamine 4-acetyltransferase
VSELPVIILGAGGHAKVLLEVLRVRGRRVTGVTSIEAGGKGDLFCGVPVLGGDEALANFTPQQIELVNGIGFIGGPNRRRQAFERGKSAGFVFATLVHPSAIVAADVQAGEGAQIMAGAVIQPGVRVGIDSIINTRAGVDHDCQIGAHAHIAPGATLCGNVTVGDSSLVGAGTTVLQGLTIGENCLIAAGALLRSNAENGTVLLGVPARVLQPASIPNE